MGKKKFIDKKKAATFVLMHTATQSADDVGARVFTRLDGGVSHVPGFSEEDPRNFGNQEEEDEDGDECREFGEFEEDSMFADAEDEDEGEGDEDLQSLGLRSSVRSASKGKGVLSEQVRVELVELGFPDDGYDYMQHLRTIGVSGVGGSFVPTSRLQLDPLRTDVKVYDSSKVAVQPSEEESDEKKIIEVLGSSTRPLRRPSYAEEGLDPEVAAALADSSGSQFDSAGELEDDFVVFANENPEESTSQEVSASGAVAGKIWNEKLERRFLEENEDDQESSDQDEADRLMVITESNRPRPSRLLDEQFEMLALREYEDNDELGEEDPEARGHADISQFDDVLSGFLTDPKVFGDKYMTPAETSGKKSASNLFPELTSVRDANICGISKDINEEVRASRTIAETRSLKRLAENAMQVQNFGDSVSDNSEDDVVIVEVDSEDKRSNWDCDSVVSTLSNLDNHPGKISAPGKPRHKQPTLEKVLEDKEARGGIIRLRGKQHLPTDFLPERPGADKSVRKAKSSIKVVDPEFRLRAGPRAGETPEERKVRKAAVKGERREARAAKKALKVLYKDETQRAQHGAAHTGPFGIHLP